MVISRSGLILLLFFASSCVSQNSAVKFSELTKVNVPNFNLEFAEYSHADVNRDFEENAVRSNFYGDHQKSIGFATRNAQVYSDSNFSVKIDEDKVEDFKSHFVKMLMDSSQSADDLTKARRMLSLLTPLQNADSIFQKKRLHSAEDFIVKRSTDFHFLLINEAHYNSQNRAFTASLLQPLWDKGYRYLALEALEANENQLMKRGYPVVETGYYLRDPVFGNMIREALKIGYKVIPYETKLSRQGTLRDQDQAEQIFNSTRLIDSIGKVIVHAGYSHISEGGDASYLPMGAQLKALAGEEILTIDQQRMTELNDLSKTNAYYKYALEKFEISEPSVFLDEHMESLVDPINLHAIDIQVYHPKSVYKDGRPNWAIREGANLYPLPLHLKQFKGHLLQALNANESQSAVPVDQIVIDGEKSLLLQPGNYLLRLIDAEGTWIGTSTLKIKASKMRNL